MQWSVFPYRKLQPNFKPPSTLSKNQYHGSWADEDASGEEDGHGWAVSSVWVRDSPPPPPLRALRAHLVTKGQWLPAIHMVAPKAPENFFHSPCQHSIP